MDRILPFFDPLPPHLVHVVIEYPLSSKKALVVPLLSTANRAKQRACRGRRGGVARGRLSLVCFDFSNGDLCSETPFGEYVAAQNAWQLESMHLTYPYRF